MKHKSAKHRLDEVAEKKAARFAVDPAGTFRWTKPKVCEPCAIGAPKPRARAVPVRLAAEVERLAAELKLRIRAS